MTKDQAKHRDYAVKQIDLAIEFLTHAAESLDKAHIGTTVDNLSTSLKEINNRLGRKIEILARKKVNRWKTSV